MCRVPSTNSPRCCVLRGIARATQSRPIRSRFHHPSFIYFDSVLLWIKLANGTDIFHSLTAFSNAEFNEMLKPWIPSLYPSHNNQRFSMLQLWCEQYAFAMNFNSLTCGKITPHLFLICALVFYKVSSSILWPSVLLECIINCYEFDVIMLTNLWNINIFTWF